MKNSDDQILEQLVGKESGMTVPEGYFDDFNRQMAEMLPNRSFVDGESRTLWQTMRPYVYMAAMFAGIWCTMYIVRHITSSRLAMNPVVAEAMNSESFIDTFVMSQDFNEYYLIEQLCDDNVDFDTERSSYQFPDSI